MAGKTMFGKIWDAHVVRQEPGGTTLLYIDRHLVHEVTSPQAFESLNLAGLGIPHEVKIYDDVGHSYMNDFGDGMKARIMRSTPMHAGYDEEASEDSWRRMLAFFEEHL